MNARAPATTGTRVAPPVRVIARKYEDLVVWQLSDELKRKVYELVETSRAERDFDFRDQIRRSAASAPTNVAEGFCYYEHPMFAKHIRVARSELAETHNHLADGVHRGYWSGEAAKPLQRLAKRASAACTALLRHLTTTQAPSSWGEKRVRR